jgi:hypothetical protein
VAKDTVKRNKRIAEWQKENKTKVLMDKDAGDMLRQAAAESCLTISDYIRNMIKKSLP